MSNPWDIPHICRGCEIDPCTKSPGECEQDAHDNYDDKKYHEEKEMD